MKMQNFLLVNVGDTIAGFMSFQHGYSCRELKRVAPCNYITTLCVKQEYRRNGIAKALYYFMLHNLDQDVRSPYVATRTWSTNLGHMALLKNIGFVTVAHLPNHRGNGIHTNYYAKQSHVEK